MQPRGERSTSGEHARRGVRNFAWRGEAATSCPRCREGGRLSGTFCGQIFFGSIILAFSPRASAGSVTVYRECGDLGDTLRWLGDGPSGGVAGKIAMTVSPLSVAVTVRALG